MANWFRMTPDGSLDKEYLTTCAVYRCLKRYGKSKQWCIETLVKRWPHMSNKQYSATRIVELWLSSSEIREK
jgi:hypothetical protein